MNEVPSSREAPSNRWPVNRAALKWLREAKAVPEEDSSYLAQLAMWGLETGDAQVPRPMSPNQPERHNLELTMEALVGADDPAFASRWFLSSPDLDEEEQTNNLLWQLNEATTAQEAAQAVVKTAYDRMVAESG